VALFTTEDLAAYLRNEIPTEDYDDLTGVATSAESLVTKVSGRKWVVASGSSTRYYAPRALHQDLIRIHDCTTVTAVLNDGTAVPAWASSTGGYQLEPINGIDWAGETRPYESIRYIGSRWKFDNYRATVAVTATWGWAAIPDQVVRAGYVIAKDMWEFRNAQNAAGFEEFIEAKAKMLLKGYRREEAKAGIGGPI
jgi:hypothetical protein